MMGVMLLMGWPFAPWQVEQTCSFPSISWALAGAPTKASRIAAPKTPEMRLMIMLCPVVVGVPPVPARYRRAGTGLTHAAVGLVAQDRGRSQGAGSTP